MPDSNFTVTRTELVSAALRYVGQFNPSTDEQNQAVMALNMLVKSLDGAGKWLWCIDNSESSLTLVASQREYAAGSGASLINANILALERVDILKNSASYVPLTIIGKKEAIGTYEREGTGEPYMVFLERAPVLANQIAHFFPTPGTAYTVKYTFRRRLYDFDNASDNPDFPGEWLLPLKLGLAISLAPEYDVPESKVMLWTQFYDRAFAAAKRLNAEELPDQRAKPCFF